MAAKILAFLGDSLTGGETNGTTIRQGGKGCWNEIIAEQLANIRGVGPLLTSGIRGVWQGNLFTNEWTFTLGGDAWTAVTSSDAWDKCLGQGKYANGQTKVATVRLNSHGRVPVGFAVYWFDYATGGDWQYRVDGGTWTNMGQTLANDNKICKFYVSGAVASTVEFRGYNGASDVGCGLAGIEWVYSTSTTGLIVHNFGASGHKLNTTCAATSGDRLAVVDLVKLGTGSPTSPTPNAGVINMNIADTLLANSTNWGTDLTTLYNRVHPLGPLGLMNPWECLTSTYDQTQQTNYRAQTLTSAAAFGTPAKTLDLYAQWSSNGWTGNAAAVAAGLLRSSDSVHQSQAGDLDLAARIYWFVRNQILGLGAVPSSYVATAKSAAVAYAGKSAAVAYAAGAPIAII